VGDLITLSAPGELVRLLEENDTTFTALAEKLAGCPVEAEITARFGETCLTSYERKMLLASLAGAETACWRSGFLRMEDGRRIADIQSLYLPGRIPDAEVRDLLAHTGIPLGKALERYEDLHREQLTADVTPGERGALGVRLAVRCSGRLWLGGSPVALAIEGVHAWFCEAKLW
jgi:hypothetical protein